MGDAVNSGKEYILCLLPFPENTEIVNGIKKEHPDVEFDYHNVQYDPRETGDGSKVPKESWSKATILVTLFTFPPDMSMTPNLRLVHLFSAGANQLMDTPVWKSDVTITNSSGVHGPQIAEWVIMQILTNSHREKLLVEWQSKHVWGKHDEIGPVKDSVKQRLGVLGYGAIGRQTARICQAMGMDVIAYTASPRKTPESKKDHGYIVPSTGDPDGSIPIDWFSGLDKPSLHNFLKQDIDILLISVPLTPQTTHFLAEEEFAILGEKNAFIVNIARGKVIKQDDLIKALKKKPEDGGLRGAALDVTDPEPLNEDSDLWDMDNVAITPHVSGLGTTYAERSFQILERNLSLIEAGKDLINVVDRKKGY